MLTPAGQSPPGTTVPGHALVGVINPTTQAVLPHPIAQPTDPARLVDLLRQLWRHTFASNTVRMATTLISTGWDPPPAGHPAHRPPDQARREHHRRRGHHRWR
jgi:hypothetical protein